jgi:hypothetical protein
VVGRSHAARGEAQLLCCSRPSVPGSIEAQGGGVSSSSARSLLLRAGLWPGACPLCCLPPL